MLTDVRAGDKALDTSSAVCTFPNIRTAERRYIVHRTDPNIVHRTDPNIRTAEEEAAESRRRRRERRRELPIIVGHLT